MLPTLAIIREVGEEIEEHLNAPWLQVLIRN